MPRGKTLPGFHAVLLAGGSGTRFWPLSRADRPKQLLALAGGEPLLKASWRRVRKLAPPSRIWVAAPSKLAGQVTAMLPALRPENLIVEPSPRDTAPAAALACATVAGRDTDAVAGLFPTDHVIADEEAFRSAVAAAVKAARRNALVCLGIQPDRPATGYGYLRCASAPRTGRAVDVERFVEKPDEGRARRFLRSGRYLWNGGMFVWKTARFLQELDRAAPDLKRAVLGHLEGKPGAWGRVPRISVDFAVMEKATGVRVVPLDAGWDDLGSWDAAARLHEEKRRGIYSGIRIGSPDSVVFGGNRVVALVDVPGVVVVDCEDAVLVVNRKSAEKVRDVVAHLRRTGGKGLL